MIGYFKIGMQTFSFPIRICIWLIIATKLFPTTWQVKSNICDICLIIYQSLVYHVLKIPLLFNEDCNWCWKTKYGKMFDQYFKWVLLIGANIINIYYIVSWKSHLICFYLCFRTPFKNIPTIGGKDVDLYLLYWLVTARGGWEKVNI